MKISIASSKNLMSEAELIESSIPVSIESLIVKQSDFYDEKESFVNEELLNDLDLDDERERD